MGFRVAPHLYDEAQQLLDAAKISFTPKPEKFQITTDAATINANADLFDKLANLVRRTWEKSA
jgi:hypothetical protein